MLTYTIDGSRVLTIGVWFALESNTPSSSTRALVEHRYEDITTNIDIVDTDVVISGGELGDRWDYTISLGSTLTSWHYVGIALDYLGGKLRYRVDDTTSVEIPIPILSPILMDEAELSIGASLNPATSTYYHFLDCIVDCIGVLPSCISYYTIDRWYTDLTTLPLYSNILTVSNMYVSEILTGYALPLLLTYSQIQEIQLIVNRWMNVAMGSATNWTEQTMGIYKPWTDERHGVNEDWKNMPYNSALVPNTND